MKYVCTPVQMLVSDFSIYKNMSHAFKHIYCTTCHHTIHKKLHDLRSTLCMELQLKILGLSMLGLSLISTYFHFSILSFIFSSNLVNHCCHVTSHEANSPPKKNLSKLPTFIKVLLFTFCCSLLTKLY
jgi:hypothetical protein